MASIDGETCREVFGNSSNGTEESGEKPQGLYIAYNVMLAMITIVIMFSMGSGIKVSDILIVVKRPVGPVIGLVCQCFIMPAACFGYSLALSLAPNLALGMVLIGSCPGGSISNIITFWTKADACLSVCMTTISTTLAIGFLPLNMFIYSRFWVDDVSGLPYVNMVITILYVWASVFVGFLFGKKFPRAVPYLTKIGSVAALILILTAGVLQGQLYPELFDLGWEAWFAAITMPIIGFVIGYILAAIFCQDHPKRAAIGFETGIQNTALALTVIAVTYPSSFEASCYSQFPLLYSTFQVVLGIAVILGAWIYVRIRYKETPCNMKHSIEEDLDEGDLVSGTGNRISASTEEPDVGLVSIVKVETTKDEDTIAYEIIKEDEDVKQDASCDANSNTSTTSSPPSTTIATDEKAAFHI